MPFDYVRHALVVLAFGRDRLESLRNNVFNVIGDEGQGIHGRDIDTSVPAVTVVHHVADLISVVNGRIGHSRSHYSGVVSLDLEVDVVRMGIVHPET